MNENIDTIKVASKILLEPSGLSEEHLRKVLKQTLTQGIDSADIYLGWFQHESWCLEDGVVKNGNFGIDQGFGIRAISGEKAGFSYSDDINLKTLQQAANAAKSIAKQGTCGKLNLCYKSIGNTELYPFVDPLSSITEGEKIALLNAAEEEVRKLDQRIVNVVVDLNAIYEVVLILSSDGCLAADLRPLVRLNIAVLAEEKGRRERGSCGGGARADYKFFLQNDCLSEYARKAVHLALVNLHASSAPAGNMPVVLGHGWPAVLLHEAVGHGLEGDFVRKGSSVYAGKIGEKVASSNCTLIDQGNMTGGKRGSMYVDDEGTPTQRTVLIENGILCGYMQDKLNARLMNAKSTGNARRDSFAHMPIPRMTNTYMLAGDSDPQEIIASVDRGLYAVNFSGGQVDITSGEFVFSTSEAYLIEKGKITTPVKKATLIGNGPEILTKITMVGNDLEMDPGVGVCGKDGQSVAVGLGQPTLRVEDLTVGGTE
jgi:TldD protein